MNLYLRKYLQKARTVLWHRNWTSFAVLPENEQQDVLLFLTEFFSGNTKSVMMKDSRTTKAGISELPDSGQPVFWKRNNNKGLSFTLRYLFRPARVFRAAAAAERFQQIGIATPRVLAVGEKRILCYLKYGYIVTESCRDIRSVTDLFKQCSNEDADIILTSFLAYCGEQVAVLHKAGMIHGDLKISNFYFTGPWTAGNFGIWDLDSVRQYRGKLDPRARTRELSRLVSSLLIQCDGNTQLEDSFFNPELLTARLMREYAAYFPEDQWIPAAGDVCRMARERWHREKHLVHGERSSE